MTAPIASGWSESLGGPCTHWKAPPFHGARRLQPFVGRECSAGIAESDLGTMQCSLRILRELDEQRRRCVRVHRG
jgi:hypothetical protein